MTLSSVALFLLAAVGSVCSYSAERDLKGQPSPPGEVCRVPPEKGWSPQGKWVWESVCAGKTADFKEWPKSCVLRPEFLKTILLREPYRSALTYKGARIQGARFVEPVDLSDATLIQCMSLVDCTFLKDVTLDRLKTSSFVMLSGSKFRGGLSMNCMKVGGYLWMRDGGEFTEVNLEAAEIDSEVNMSNSKFGGKLDMYGTKVGGDLSLETGAEFAEVELMYAKIDGSVYMANSKFGGKLDMYGTKVGGDLSLGKGAAFTEVKLIYAKIDGSVYMAKCKFGDKLDMYGMKVGGDLFMNDGAEFTKVNLVAAKIDGSVYMAKSKFGGELHMNSMKVGGHLSMGDGSVFDNQVSMILSRIESHLSISGSAFNSLDLAGTHIGGEFRLGRDEKGRETQWVMQGSRLILRNTEIGAIEDQENAWPPNLELDGFKYSHLGGSAGDEKSNIGWLEKQKTYSPQPYEQRADVVKKMGFPDKANEILFAKKEREQKEAWVRHQWLSWFSLAAQRCSIGYGYHIFWSLGWVSALIVAGWLIAMRTFQGKCKGPVWCFIYSLDLLLPIIQLDKRNYDTHLGGRAKYYFYVHKIFGYVLASFIIAGISGLTKQ